MKKKVSNIFLREKYFYKYVIEFWLQGTKIGNSWFAFFSAQDCNKQHRHYKEYQEHLKSKHEGKSQVNIETNVNNISTNVRKIATNKNDIRTNTKNINLVILRAVTEKRLQLIFQIYVHAHVKRKYFVPVRDTEVADQSKRG